MGRGSWLARLPSAKKRHVEGWAFRPSEGVHMMCGRSPCGWWLHLGYPYGAALTSGPNEPQMRSLSQRDGRILEGKSTRRSAGDADIKASTSRVIRPRTTSKHAFARPASCEGCGRMHKGDRRKGWSRTGFGGVIMSQHSSTAVPRLARSRRQGIQQQSIHTVYLATATVELASRGWRADLDHTWCCICGRKQMSAQGCKEQGIAQPKHGSLARYVFAARERKQNNAAPIPRGHRATARQLRRAGRCRQCPHPQSTGGSGTWS